MNETKPHYKNYVTFAVAVLFPFYSFFQYSLLNPLASSLLDKEHITSFYISLLSAVTLFSNGVFLIIGGHIINKIGVKYAVLFGLVVEVLATFFLIVSTKFTFIALFISRIMIGAAHSFAIACCFLIVVLSFKNKQKAFFMGLVPAVGIAGSFFSQRVFSFLITMYDWKSAVFIDGIFGAVIFLLTFSVFSFHCKENWRAISKTSMFAKPIYYAFFNKTVWFLGGTILLLCIPISLFGNTWGIIFLENNYHYSPAYSSKAVAYLFAGIIIGSPIVSYFKGIFNIQKHIVIILMLELMLILSLLYIDIPNKQTISLLFFTLGFLVSTQIICYQIITENIHKKSYIAVLINCINLIGMLGVSAFQLIFSLGFIQAPHQGRVDILNNHLGIGTMIILFIIVVILILYEKIYSEIRN